METGSTGERNEGGQSDEPNKAAAIRRARAKGTGIRRIARDMGVGVGTVLRLIGEA